MNGFVVILTIIFLTGTGFVIIRWFNILPKAPLLSIVGYSYGLGVGLIGMQLYLYSRLSIMWSRETIIVPWIIAGIIFLIQQRQKINFPKRTRPKLHTFSLILLAAIFCAVAYVLFEAVLRPVSAWDAWAIWLLKAKVFFIDNGIKPGILNYVKSDYPLIISLLGTFVYIVLGHVNDTAVLLAFFGFYFFLAILFFSVVRQRFGLTFSLLCTLFLVTTQTIIRQGGRIEAGQADLAVGYFAFISFTLLMDYLKNNQQKVLILLCIFLAFTGLVKFDGIPITLAIGIFLVIHILQNKLYKHFYLLLFWIIPLVDWQLYKKLNNVTKTYFSAHVFVYSFGNSVQVVKKEFLELINIKSWNVLWIAYFYTLYNGLRKNNELFILHCIILSQICIYTLLYFFTLNNNPESSFERLLVHIAPLALYSVAIYVHLFLKQISSTKPGKLVNKIIIDNNKS